MKAINIHTTGKPETKMCISSQPLYCHNIAKNMIERKFKANEVSLILLLCFPGLGIEKFKQRLHQNAAGFPLFEDLELF